MKKVSLAAAVTLSAVSLPAFAHLEIGVYSGKTSAGENCTFEVKSVTFQNNIKHPLNEKVEVVYQGQNYTLSHLPIVDAQNATIKPDKERLTGAHSNGELTQAFVLTMSHGNGKDGPSSFVAVSNPLPSSNLDKMMLSCGALNFQK